MPHRVVSAELWGQRCLPLTQLFAGLMSVYSCLSAVLLQVKAAGGVYFILHAVKAKFLACKI